MAISTIAPRSERSGCVEAARPLIEESFRRSPWQVLHFGSFRFYFFGSLASNIGTWLQNTAQVLIAYQLTHSVFTVGLVVSAQFAGMLVLSPWAAVLASRMGGKGTLIGTQCFSAVAAGAMAWRYYHHVLGVHSLVIGALGLGVAFSLALPMQTAMVPTLVDPADTKAAMAMNSVSYQAGRALAPALCVPILAFVGAAWIFALNAASFVIFAVVLGCLKFGARRKAGPDHSATAHTWRRTRVMDGVRTARRYRRILFLLTVVATVTFADDPILVLSPGLARTHLHVSGNWAGYFIAALGWGTVAGSFWPTSRQEGVNPSHASRRVAWLLLALAGSVIVFALGVSAPVSLFAAVAAGVAALFTGATAQSLTIGRHHNNAASIAGLWAIAWAGTKPIASLLDGWLAVHVGIVLTSLDLVLPAVILAVCEISLSAESKQAIKDWSLTGYLELHPRLKRVLSSLSDRLRWDLPSEEGLRQTPVAASVASG